MEEGVNGRFGTLGLPNQLQIPAAMDAFLY